MVTSTSTLSDIDKVYLSPNEQSVIKQGGVVRQTLETVQRLVNHQPWVNVLDYGADPTGTRFCSTNIHDAINALPATGGDVIIPQGTYKFNSGFTIGNGSTSNLSSISGIRLRGMGVPANPVINRISNFGGSTGNAGMSGVTFQCTMSGIGGMINFNGMSGWGVSNIYFNTPNSATEAGLQLTSCSFGLAENLSFSGFTNQAMLLNTLPAQINGLADCIHNKFHGITIMMSSAQNAKGIFLTSTTTPFGSTDADGNVFIDTVICINCPSTSFGTQAIYCAICDSNTFYDTFVVGVQGSFTLNSAVAFDYSQGNNQFPGGNKFYKFGSQFAISEFGSPLTTNIDNHEFYGYDGSGSAGEPLATAQLKTVSWYTGPSQRSQVVYTSTSVPTATGNSGMRTFITDASSSGTFGSSLTTGGAAAVTSPIYSDGTKWRFG